jgi:hypothetical protein
VPGAGATKYSAGVPGSAGFSEAYSINLLGAIVGDSADADGMVHGFLRSNQHPRRNAIAR